MTAPQGETRFVPASYINSPVSYTVSQVTLSFLLSSDIIILSACFPFRLKHRKHLFSGRGWGFSVHGDPTDTDMIKGATGWMFVPRCYAKGQITVLTMPKVSCHCRWYCSGKQDSSACRHMNRLFCRSLLSPFFPVIEIAQKSVSSTVMSCLFISKILIWQYCVWQGVSAKQEWTTLSVTVWAKLVFLIFFLITFFKISF